MASGSKKGGWEAKGEKVQTSCRRRIWKENHKMQKVQAAWTHGENIILGRINQAGSARIYLQNGESDNRGMVLRARRSSRLHLASSPAAVGESPCLTPTSELRA
ncbi:hypothetical protein E2562_018732 [Oryza meyeriana var. granulata]|uniref:Uncharacterized protein n=1 Tax=Oryza meyeriana var. granulata TaxID=110450 RepID=A0A6G1EMR9_9ORYZ|nr:hypothetical protein E2562_018732 [Oryza meyeriana var. granulata]